MKPECSVIIPVFNVETYIIEAITSILKQSIQNIEVIVIDDCSTDNTYKLLEEIAKNDFRVKLFKNKTNLKISRTLNYAISVVNSDYIVRMDGDDISAKDRLAVLLTFIKNNDRYDIVGTSMTAISQNGIVLHKETYSSSPDFIKNTLKYSSPLAHIWIAKRTVYETLGEYRDISGVEDYDFLLRAISYGFNITNISNYYGYFVRKRDGNTASIMGLKQIILHDYVWSLYLERLRTGKKTDSFNQLALSNILDNHSTFSIKIHNFSNSCLNIAIRFKRNPFISIPFLLVAFISPYQISYISRRLSYRYEKLRHAL